MNSCLHLKEGSDLKSLIDNGIIAGVGGVVVFVPVIFFIFLFLSILEQSGYIARVVVVLDRLLRRFGLHGQSILPMVLGGGVIGGCAVPAVMATRTMHEQRERLLTILVIPFMNCGAKIPVYALLIAAFFASCESLVMTAIVLLSWTLALFSAWLLGLTVVRGLPMPLVIELPTYQKPRLIDVLRTACLQSWWFVKKAGTIILFVNVLLWALMYYPHPADPNIDAKTRLENSYAGRLGHVLMPVSRWAGFDWRDNVALIGGVAAKEVIVSSLSTVYGIETANDGDKVDGDESDERLTHKLQVAEGWSPLKAFAMLLFVMIYAPCIPTCAVIQKETGSYKYMLLALVYSTTLAFLLAVAVFQIGRCFG
jgi:ferrous iron transport protein B